MTYLIHNTAKAAWSRADAEGAARNLPYHTGTGITRYVTSPRETADGQWALEVSNYDLTEAEQAQTVESVEWPQLEEEI